MMGKFTVIDDRRCVFYARFMSGLTLPQANGLYWVLFMFVLFLMCISANLHNKSMSLQSEIKSKRDEKRIRRIRQRFLGFVTICFLIASVCAVFEVFALLNIQFCDGEDLIVFYWDFWGFLQVGSIIAIFGVILNLWITIADVHTPSWVVALGIRVLVFAALNWILQFLWRRTWLEFTGKVIEGEEDPDERDDGDEEEGSIKEEERRQLEYEERKYMDRWNSRAPTLTPRQSTPPGQPLMPTYTRRSSI